MKFLYFSLELPALLNDSREFVGGAAVQWKSWISGITGAGHRFGLLTWKGANSFVKKKDNLDIVESIDPKRGIKNLRLFYPQFFQLFKAIKSYKPDFVIQSSATAYTGILMLVSKILGIPFIHRIASDVHVDNRLSTLISSKEIHLYKFGVKYSDIILTQNNYQYKELKKKYPEKNITIIHNPYANDYSDKPLPRANRQYIAWVGNFRRIKNVMSLADVAEKLDFIDFKIAGVESIADKETQEAVKKLKNLKNVEFVGYLTRTELKTFLSKAIAVLNTSFTEGFSNTFLEAWSLGVPVITTKNVNPDELIEKYNLGFVADSYSYLPELVKKINDLEFNLYNEMSIRCVDYVKTNHDPKFLADKLVEYLKSLIK
ncbi:MAG: glycosyltransferase family 4 protein [Ignavibacteriae bacterium]|nr:glycosyltransferase family 4 protein [Ignavibacteriota bacterium]